MEKIDKRKTYIIMIDTETCNGIDTEDGGKDLSCSLCYDIGIAVVDKKGRCYRKKSYVVNEIFFGMKDLMQTAYYANKIPQYYEQIKTKERTPANMYTIRQYIKECMSLYNTNIVCAHNTLFDLRALNNTIRWVTKSKYRYFFPKDTIFWDTMLMAQTIINKQKSYRDFCIRHGYLTKQGRNRLTAEILYRYITKDNRFKEKHTGLEDVNIERKILAYCFKQHKKMRKALFENKEVA